MSTEVFLGRQPIVDADRQVFGFEVLYRDGPGRTSSFDDPEAATRGVMERIFLQWGMEHLVGDHFGLVNASANLVVRGLHRAMPPEGMIIEIREPEPFDEATVDALQQARYAGYHFALDNVNRLGDLEQSRLLPLASLVKIELTTAHDAEIPRLISVARDRSPGILVVAEKVESVADFKRCVEHGFDLFQGYYIAEPEVLRRPARPAGTRSATALYVALLDDEPGIDVGRLETIMASDPSLAFRLLTAVNASAFGLDRNVGSLEQAMGLLGPDRLRCLAELIALSGDTIDDDIHIRARGGSGAYGRRAPRRHRTRGERRHRCPAVDRRLRVRRADGRTARRTPGHRRDHLGPPARSRPSRHHPGHHPGVRAKRPDDPGRPRTRPTRRADRPP